MDELDVKKENTNCRLPPDKWVSIEKGLNFRLSHVVESLKWKKNKKMENAIPPKRIYFLDRILFIFLASASHTCSEA